jgi:hypothetical protein
MRRARTGVVVGLVVGVAAGFVLGRVRAPKSDEETLRRVVVDETSRLGEQLDRLEQSQRGALAMQFARSASALGTPPTSSPSAPLPSGSAAKELPRSEDDDAPALDEATARERSVQGHGVIAGAIAAGGVWNDAQREALRGHMASLPPDAVRGLMQEVIVALNEGKLKLDRPGPPL